MKTIAIILLAFAALTGYVRAAPLTEGTLGEKHSVTVGPLKVHEICQDVSKDGSLSFNFVTTMPVDFNIHFHKDNNIFYPVRRRDISSVSSIFTAEIAERYCLMWTNRGGDPVTLNYQYKIQ